VGATVQLPRLDWVLSAFWGKCYQAPPLETLSGPLVGYATSSDTAFLPLRGERDMERQFGVTILLLLHPPGRSRRRQGRIRCETADWTLPRES
jgi:hypothetical protein